MSVTPAKVQIRAGKRATRLIATLDLRKMKKRILIAFVSAFIAVFTLLFVRQRNDRIQTEATLSVYTMENWWPIADENLLRTVEKGLGQYYATATSHGVLISDWTVTKDIVHGVIQTGWFRTHKGEVTLKAIVKVWGPYYRVDVWHKAGSGINKFFYSFAVESEIQEAIEMEKQRKSNQAL